LTVFVFYISGHGWGHATRDIELMNAIGRRAPGARCIARTSVAPWLFERSAQVPVDVESLEVDTGVVQMDSLSLDEEETARRAAAFYRDFDRRVTDEAAYLRRAGGSIVVGDIPPLAFAAAARAGLPSVAVGNFTWDWIYAAYRSFDALAPDVIPLIRDAYASAGLALRLPMRGGFETMRDVICDIPFIARRSMRNAVETRQKLGAAEGRPMVLVSFGGYGLQLPCDEVAQSGGLKILNVQREPPDGLKYEDLVAAADVVLSKPGYGIISDCLAHGTPLLYTSRGHFVEYDVLVAEMPRWLKCRYISQEDLVACRWANAVEALLRQPAPPDHARVDGAAIAADAIVRTLNLT
jgi:hypothetical protein